MIYFASDVHLGLKFKDKLPRQHEKTFVDFLSSIEHNCTELFLLGDIFDFWFEWNRTIPKGYARVLGKLASMCDKGIKIHLFTGNHDLWLGTYFTQEIGMEVHFGELIINRENINIFLAHGDIYYRHKFIGRVISKIFRSSKARWIGQRIIHPDALVRFGMNWSKSNRDKRGGLTHTFNGEDDFLVQFARRYLIDNQNINAFIFGHEHTPVAYPLNEKCKLYILGEWVENPVYGVLENGEVKLVNFPK